METKLTLKEIKAMVKKADPTLSAKEEAFRAAVVLIANASGLKTAKEIAALTHYPLGHIETMLANLKASRLGWGRKNFRHSGWQKKDTGGLAFWMDVTVAMGYLEAA